MASFMRAWCTRYSTAVFLPVILSLRGISEYTQAFNLTAMIQSIIKGALAILSIIIIILINRKYLLEYADRPAMGVLFAVIAVTTGCYTVIHFSNGAEGKFLLLSLVALGIPGGIAFYRLCERLHRVLFIICVSAAFRRHSFRYQAASWQITRRVVAKIEWHAGELFPRIGFIVTNLRWKHSNVVKFYNKRGTAEQWIKEGKYALKWTRLSCHDFVDNQVRLSRRAGICPGL